jgi:hypothetical protein
MTGLTVGEQSVNFHNSDGLLKGVESGNHSPIYTMFMRNAG